MATTYSSPSAVKNGLFQRGPVGLAVIAAHILLIYFVAASLGIVEMPSIAKPMEAVIIDAPQTEKSEPVKVIKPQFEQPQIETPPLEDTIPEIEVPTDEPAPAAITAETSPAPPVPETANMKVNRRVDPVYPAASRRAGEEGMGVFRVLVDANGRPQDVTVVSSTGHPRLDEAAIAAILKWTFSPAMQAGQAVQSYTKVQVKFELQNAAA
ncbi:MAG TPA: TonB family protein [Steroidobacteraceae bacterium]|jgi:protein TonB|nr:TonB family protein [Steroidobacteraceae bacterium]